MVDCRRKPRGPYTGTGDLLRAIVPEVHGRAPEIIARHALTLLSIAPELRSVIPVSDELARSFEFSREGYSRFFTLRLAHGVVDFLDACFADSVCTLCFDNADSADSLDRELVAVLLRRLEPEKILVSVGSRSQDVAEPLLSALRSYADINEQTGASESLARDVSPEPFDAGDLAFFLARSAYCMSMAYYEACLDLARRGTALVHPHSAEYGELGRNIVFSLLLLDRLDEVEAYCRQAESLTSQPALRSHCAYAMAILYARVYENEKRDYEASRRWVEKALALAERVPNSETKVVNLVFLRNTLALVELRTGHPQQALSLLSAGLERLETEAPSKYRMESVILLHNRARIHVALGQPERALEDYALLLGQEPSSSAAHFDRGIIYQRLGRHREALADYDLAITWSPPYDEVHFNRAQVLSALGRKEEALEAYRYVLALEPEHVGALIHSAGLRYERSELAEARQDIDRAIARGPHDAKALCMLGLIEMAERRYTEAQKAFDRALESDETEVTAWINRATLFSHLGQPEAALRDLDKALELGAGETARHNRAHILQTLMK